MRQLIFWFGGLAALIFLLLQISRFSLFRPSFSQELIVVLFAGAFIGIGFLTTYLVKSREMDITEAQRQKKAEAFNLSEREVEVLKLMEKGLSNQEIGQELFISENTVKTHVSNILSKTDSRRRTQAVQLARKYGVLD